MTKMKNRRARRVHTLEQPGLILFTPKAPHPRRSRRRGGPFYITQDNTHVTRLRAPPVNALSTRRPVKTTKLNWNIQNSERFPDFRHSGYAVP